MHVAEIAPRISILLSKTCHPLREHPTANPGHTRRNPSTLPRFPNPLKHLIPASAPRLFLTASALVSGILLFERPTSRRSM
jgi:hypothetical protein